MMKAGPRCLGIKSLADSDADVDDAGYSPPVPKIGQHWQCAFQGLGDDHTEADHTTRHCHHPEHAVNGNSMRCSSEDSTDDNHECSKNDGGLSTEIVTS